MKPPTVIHCLGDSHCCFFSGQDRIFQSGLPAQHALPFFRVYHLGAALAYSLVKSGSQSGGRDKLFSSLRERVPPGSRVMLCFGEIDCRSHLIKRAEETPSPLADVAGECVDRYFGVVLEVRALGFDVLVYNAPPSSRRPNRSPYPSYGSAAARNQVTIYFNNHLAARCAAEGIPFLANFPDLVPAGGASRESCFYDNIHLSQRGMPATLRRLGALYPAEDFTPPPAWKRAVFWARFVPFYKVKFPDSALPLPY
jgi:hypothetical protein